MVVREIDIVKWESDAARQMISEFDVQGIPYTRVYDKSGEFLGEVRGGSIEQIAELARKGLGS